MPVMPKYKPTVRTSTLNSILVYLKTFLRSELRYLTSISNTSKIKILIFTSTKLIPPLSFPLQYMVLSSTLNQEPQRIIHDPKFSLSTSPHQMYYQLFVNSSSHILLSFSTATTMVQTTISSLNSQNSLLSYLPLSLFPSLITSLYNNYSTH